MSNSITNLNVGGKQFNVDDLLNSKQEETTESTDVQEDSVEEQVTSAVNSATLTHKDEWKQDLQFNRIELSDAERILDLSLIHI